MLFDHRDSCCLVGFKLDSAMESPAGRALVLGVAMCFFIIPLPLPRWCFPPCCHEVAASCDRCIKRCDVWCADTFGLPAKSPPADQIIVDGKVVSEQSSLAR